MREKALSTGYARSNLLFPVFRKSPRDDKSILSKASHFQHRQVLPRPEV